MAVNVRCSSRFFIAFIYSLQHEIRWAKHSVFESGCLYASIFRKGDGEPALFTLEVA